MQVGLITEDHALRDRIARLVATTGASLRVATEPGAAQAIMASREIQVRILDEHCPDLRSDCGLWMLCAPTLTVEAKAARRCGKTLSKRVLLVVGDPGRAQEPLRITAFPRDPLDALLEELSLLLPRPPGLSDAAEKLLGDSLAIRRVRAQVRSIASFRDISVLILGETGTGKEMVARAIHELSCGPEDPFVPINCSAIPENLFESELFGHEAGAYTGAQRARAGLMESAGSGTIFLDEIGEMPPSLQPKLLRAIESAEFRRVGANRSIPLRARIISATNRTLSGASGSTLRPDLYYRLAGYTILVSPLRERSTDITILSAAFLRGFGTRHHTRAKRFDEQATGALLSYAWPGNVRELKSVVERCAIAASGGLIGHDEVRGALGQLEAVPAMVFKHPHGGPGPIRAGLREFERELVVKAFSDSEGNLSRAARTLGIPRTTLRAKLQRLGLL